MPYDGSGNFTRNYNWTDDKLAGIKIESERMDGEFDNFAAGMNQVMLRNGAIPWTGDLKLNGNKIVGLADGTAPSPALSFLSDTTTGIFLQSAGNFSVSASGIERLRVHSLGITVLGTTFTSTISPTPPGLWQIYGDASWTNFIFDTTTTGGQSYLQWDVANKVLNYVISGVSKAYFDANAGFHTSGDITANHITATGIDVPANTFSGASLVDGTVTTSKIADGSITFPKMAAGSVDSTKWIAGASFTASNGAGFALVNGAVLGAANTRWFVGLTGSEAAGSAGNDLYINRFDNAGAYLGTPFTITRSNGNTSVGNLNSAGSIVAQGNVQALGTLFFGTPSGNQSINADANSTVLNFNPNCYLQYVKATGFLNYVVNGAIVYSINGLSGAVKQGSTDFSNGSLTNIASISAAGNITSAADLHAGGWVYATAGLAVGPASSARFITDGSTFTQLYWNFNSPAYDQYSWSTGLFQKVVNGTVIHSIDFAGSATFLGNLTNKNYRLLQLSSATGGADNIYIDGPVRWQHQYNTSGDYLLNRYDISGTFLGTVWSVNLSNGIHTHNLQNYFTLGSGSYLTGNLPINILGSGPGILFNSASAGIPVSFGQLTAAQGSGGRVMAFTKYDGAFPPVYFDINTGIAYAISHSNTSDRRLKSDIQPVASGLDILASLKPYTFKVATSLAEAAEGVGVPSAGVMAQDLIGTPLERLVNKAPLDENDDFYTMDYSGLTAWYIAAFKDTKRKLDAAEAKVTALEKALHDITRRVKALERS